MSDAPIKVEVNGQPATAEQLQHPALVNYGHFTALQARQGRTRGLDLHLTRLDQASRQLFGAGLKPDLIRDHIRHALDGVGDASVRVSVFWPQDDPAASVMVALRPPVELADAAVALKSVPYLRPVPHIKHLGGFAQLYYGRLARLDGFDDALLTGPDGSITETARANIGLFDGASVSWPDAPCLAGVTMQLLEPRLADAGLPTRRAPVRLTDISSFTAAFVTNSHGLQPVGRIDSTELAVDQPLMKSLNECYRSVRWDEI